jgi:hypothetical protein
MSVHGKSKCQFRLWSITTVAARIELLPPVVPSRMAGRSARDPTTAGASVRWFGAGSNAAIRGFDPKVRLHAIDYYGLYIDVGTALTGRVLPSRS